MLDPQNWRHTDRELGRYVVAHVESAKSCPHVALAGPDATKVGTDLGLLLAAAMNPATGVTAVCIPQASVLFVQFQRVGFVESSVSAHVRVCACLRIRACA